MGGGFEEAVKKQKQKQKQKQKGSLGALYDEECGSTSAGAAAAKRGMS